MTPEQFQATFSPERLRIMLLLREAEVESVSALAQRTGRLFEAVHRDVRLLESYGIVELKKAGRNVIPSLAGKITILIA